MKLVYLASPYKHELQQVTNKRFRDASKAAGNIVLKFADEGIVVFSPIAHAHNISKYAKIPAFSEVFYRWSEEILSRCDEVWILDIIGWDQSVGIRAEIELAKKLDKPIKMVTLRGRKYAYKG
jgi:Domain of unknown function (DUF1937)